MKDLLSKFRDADNGTFDATETISDVEMGPSGIGGTPIAIHVPSVTGTNPTLDIVFWESASSGGTYRRVATVEQITAAGDHPVTVHFKQEFGRVVLTLGGTSSPAFGAVYVGVDDGIFDNDLQVGFNH